MPAPVRPPYSVRAACRFGWRDRLVYDGALARLTGRWRFHEPGHPIERAVRRSGLGGAVRAAAADRPPPDRPRLVNRTRLDRRPGAIDFATFEAQLAHCLHGDGSRPTPVDTR